MIWLQNDGINDVNHILILYGGDILFLKTIKKFPTGEPKIRDAIKNLNSEQFFKLCNLPIKSHVSEIIRKWINEEKIPPYIAENNSKKGLNKEDIQEMLKKIDAMTNGDKKTKIFQYIIYECEKRLSNLNESNY